MDEGAWLAKHGGAWLAVLPPSEAISQTAWERRHLVLRAHKAGASTKLIGRHLGISKTMVLYLIKRARRDFERGDRSPLERWLSQTTRDLIEIEQRIEWIARRDARRGVAPLGS